MRGSFIVWLILVPRGRAPFGQHQKSRPLARSNDIPVLNGFVNTIDWDQNQSHLSDLTLSMRRVTGSPWIADFRCWTWPEVVIFGADQKERGLWGREWVWLWLDFAEILSLPPRMHGMQRNIDYFMVGERVRFLFTSCEESQTNERVFERVSLRFFTTSE